MKKIIIKSGREKSLLRRHPWIFSGAIKSSGDLVSGDAAKVVGEDGRFLCHALASVGSQIAARAVSFDELETVDDAFFVNRIHAAILRRQPLREGGETNAIRLIHGESDGLPGLVVDQYADVVVMQLTTAGIEPHRELIAEALAAATGARSIYERSDADVRALEGLAPRNGLVRGAPVDAPILVNEGGMRIAVDVVNGHKTGFYIDQRDNRRLTRELATGKRVLNCFCYTGTMSIAALQGGASAVLSIDSSEAALATARNIAAQNEVDTTLAEWMEADVFQALRKLRDQGQQFDLIILDPPKLAPTIHHVEKATRAYKDINLLGFKLLRPGGLLMTYSCSGGMSAELFQKVVAGAALDAKAEAQILQRLTAGRDHPISVHFPEGDYLKGLLLQKIA